jgi:hypothetical protein
MSIRDEICVLPRVEVSKKATKNIQETMFMGGSSEGLNVDPPESVG